MKLKGLLVADPVESVATLIASNCDRLADVCVTSNTGERTLTAAASLKPEMVILSLELTKPATVDVARELKKFLPDAFIVITFRELAIPTMERLGRLEVGDFMPQPVDFAALYRAASRHFGMGFRRHERHNIALDVTRADGVLIGKTRDLSEGGMQMDAFHPVNENESMLVDLALPDDKALRVRCHVLMVEGEAPKSVKARIQFENLRGREHERLVAFLSGLTVK